MAGLNFKHKDLKIDYYKSSGPGGQHKNKRETAVRIKHLPTGLTVIASNRRSQAQNKKIALERLEKKIAQLKKKKKKRIPTTISPQTKERILQAKKRKSQKKRLRQKIKDLDVE